MVHPRNRCHLGSSSGRTSCDENLWAKQSHIAHLPAKFEIARGWSWKLVKTNRVLKVVRPGGRF